MISPNTKARPGDTLGSATTVVETNGLEPGCGDAAAAVTAGGICSSQKIVLWAGRLHSSQSGLPQLRQKAMAGTSGWFRQFITKSPVYGSISWVLLRGPVLPDLAPMSDAPAAFARRSLVRRFQPEPLRVPAAPAIPVIAIESGKQI